MKKNQNGVTLIALAVTIIVMLILAGVTMATLTGDNGIITQSRRTAAASTEGTVKEKMTSAFNSIMLQVNMDRAGSEAYIAQDHIADYLDTVVNQIGASEAQKDTTKLTTLDGKSLTQVKAATVDTNNPTYKYVTYVVETGSKAQNNLKSYIYIDYCDTTFKLGLGDPVNTKTSEYPFLRMKIEISTNAVSYNGPTTNALK